LADDFAVGGDRIVKDRARTERLRRRTAAFDATRLNFAEAAGTAFRAACRLTSNDPCGVEAPRLAIEHFERER